MTKHLLILASALFFLGSGNNLRAQTTATDFTATDCGGADHTLFSELNDGKVVIICWVMPCGTCISPALTITSSLENYAKTNPGKLKFYVVDDYGNSNCSTLETWCSSNEIKPDAIFSNSAINMTAYGSAGMPKTIVLAGNEHKVLLNNNGSLSATTLNSAIDNALITATTKQLSQTAPLKLSPNPAQNASTTLSFNLELSSEVKVSIRTMTGVLLQEANLGYRPVGELTYLLALDRVIAGTYIVVIETALGRRESLLSIL